MRTASIEVNGRTYLTCLSTRVLMALEERGGDADAELRRVLEGGKLADLFWLLAQMIDAGSRYARHEGLDDPGTLTFDQLVDLMGPDDYQRMNAAVAETVKAGTQPTVEVRPAPGKNADASQAAG